MATVQQNKIRIRLKAYDHEADRQERRLDRRDRAAQRRHASPAPCRCPTERNVYCVIRGPFKDKDSREHFEIRTHKRLIDIYSPTPKTVDSLMRLEPPGRRGHRDQA